MATLNFYLDKADKQGKSFIMMTYLAGGQKFRHSVKLKIFPGKWLNSKQSAKALLKRNDGQLPKLFNNAWTNFYLKEIGKLAGIDEQTQIIKYRGVEKVEFIEPKYKFIGTHTARRTFVTLCLEKGMRPETVMSITGHKDYKSFKKYIKLTDKVKLVEMNRIWSKNLYIA